MIQMISRVVSGALFLCVGVIYDRMHTRDINFYGGLVNRMPIYATVFMIFMLGSVGLPGKWFYWRILLVGAFQYSHCCHWRRNRYCSLSSLYVVFVQAIILG